MGWTRRLLVSGAMGVALSGAAAPAALAGGGAAGAVHRVHAHVFAPYFETYAGDDAATLAAASGATNQIFAFLQTASNTVGDSAASCTVYWNGNPGTPVEWSVLGPQIQRIRAMGGNVWPSFGGYTADTFGYELADSCTSVSAIAADYERVISTYDFTRLDMDVETDYCGVAGAAGTCAIPGALQNTAGINRRNQAIAMVERWARENHRPLDIEYTLPVTQSGPLAAEDAVLQSAVSSGARVAIVNAMTFDYYSGEPNNMVQDTASAAQGLFNELRTLYPARSPEQLWHMVGITEMIGIDDYGPDETLTPQGAAQVVDWARQHGIGLLSYWALQRDSETGQPAQDCPFTGTQATWAGASGDCSSLVQTPWEFSHIFEGFPHPHR